MGATLFTMTEYGRDVEKVFKKLVDEAIHMYGNSPYNGTISTTSLGYEIHLDDKLEKAILNGDWETLEKNEQEFFTQKWYTNYSKIKSHYNAFVPKWINDKENVTRKKGVRNLAKFSVIPESQLNKNLYLTKYSTISEAKRVAKQTALDRGENVYIVQHRSNGETFKLGLFKLETDGKKYKSARKSKSRVYLPVYRIDFYVYAAT